MTIRNLDRLLAPRSVALIGASDRPGSIGHTMVRNLIAGFRGRIMPVNPKHGALDGLTCFPDVATLPETPKLAVIATPAPTVPGLIAALGSRGCKAAVVISAGFTGPAGSTLKQAMLDAAKPHLLRILGPNCVGVLVPGAGLNAGFAHLSPPAGRIAFLAQSGAVVTSVIDWAVARGLGFSHLVSMGEMLDVDFADMLDYLASDPDTQAVLLYVESIGNARKFMSAARAAARSKPVIAIKAGRHEEGARAVISHTGALAGADAVYDAAFRRAGVLRVYELSELFAAAETLGSAEPIEGERLAILTNGGGIGILAADALAEAGGHLAEISPATLARLDGQLPKMWSRANPVDIVGDADAQRYATALDALFADPAIDALLVLNCPTAVADGVAVAEATLAAHRRSGRCMLTSWLGEATALRARALFEDASVPTYETPEDAVRGFMHLVQWRRSRIQLAETPPSIPQDFRPDETMARRVIDTALGQGRTMLTGPESRAVIAAYGIPVLVQRKVADATAAGAAAAELGGPVALKILSPGITHKSDFGGVALGLVGAAGVTAAAERMLASVRAVRPDARIEGFTVEPMAEMPAGIELILGVSEDFQFGPVMLFGQGGLAVEQFDDRALALPPLNLALASEMIQRTRIYRLLRGYRDRPPVDLNAIALALVKLSQLVCETPEIVEIDINPLLAGPGGVLALDARIKLTVQKRGLERLAIRPYPAELEEDVRIEDGPVFRLRPIRPEDEPALKRFFGRLSPHAVRMRFFTTMKELSHALAAQLTQIDYDRQMAFVLTEPGPAGPSEIHGVARLAADPDGEQAEYAVTVEDSMTGHGIGRLLMGRLIAYASKRGIREIFGEVLAENITMLDFCRHLGFHIEASAENSAVMLTRLAIS